MPADKKITCVERECGREFVFTGADQDRFREKGLFEPKRCPHCRARRRQDQRSQGS